MSQYGAISSPAVTPVLSDDHQSPSFWCRVFVFTINFLLASSGAILTCVGYNGDLDVTWGHLGFFLLCLGAMSGFCAYGLIAFKRTRRPLYAYHCVPDEEAPSTSYFEQQQLLESPRTRPAAHASHPEAAMPPPPEATRPPPEASMKPLQAAIDRRQEEAKPVASQQHDPAKAARGSSQNVKELLDEEANILTSKPSVSPQFQSFASTDNSKGSVYTSTEIGQQDSSAGSAATPDSAPVIL